MRKTILLSVAFMCGSIAASAQEYFYTGSDYIPVEMIDSITYEDFEPKTVMLPSIMAKDENISLFNEALALTKLDDVMCDWIDDTYTVGRDSIDWTNNQLIMHVASEYCNVAYPKERRKMFTAFVEPNSVYAKYGINNIDDLKAYAKQIYDEVYPEDADITDPTDRRNSLNRFVAYHFLNRRGEYYTLTAVDGANSTLAKNWDRTVWDIADWYETLMPHSLMKFSFPAGSSEGGLYINRRGVMERADYRGVKIRGAKVATPVEMGDIETESQNGLYHYIDDIIHYGKQTQEEVLDERMRIDATTLSPDFMTSGARGHYTRFTNYENGKYGGMDTTPNTSNKRTCLGFKAGSVENFEYTDENHLHVRPRTLSYWSYQGDEVAIAGIYDVTVKLPPVPAGTYELRLSTCVGSRSGGIVQFYLDDVECGAPVDFRISGSSEEIGWKRDRIGDWNDDVLTEKEVEELLWVLFYDTYDIEYLESLNDEQYDECLATIFSDVNKDIILNNAIKQNDKELRCRGWMKGPASYYWSTSESGGTRSTWSFRDISTTLRRIICTFESDGKTDHYLRMQQTVMSRGCSMIFDYIELCPKSVYDNELYPEDIY